MKTRRRKKPAKPEKVVSFTGYGGAPVYHTSRMPPRGDDRIPPKGNGDRGGYVRIHHEGSIPLTAKFIDVDTAELLVIDDLGKIPDVEGRFVKVAPRILVSEREAFDGAAVAAGIRAKGARAVVLAPIMIGEVRKVEPEKLVKRTPRETVKAWFDEQKTIDVETREAAVELVFGFMDDEGL